MSDKPYSASSPTLLKYLLGTLLVKFALPYLKKKKKKIVLPVHLSNLGELFIP